MKNLNIFIIEKLRIGKSINKYVDVKNKKDFINKYGVNIKYDSKESAYIINNLNNNLLNDMAKVLDWCARYHLPRILIQAAPAQSGNIKYISIRLIDTVKNELISHIAIVPDHMEMVIDEESSRSLQEIENISFPFIDKLLEENN